ncbi:MAG: hypothetical protein PUG70_03355 [Lachnospiraceae bacterium]|nr:hypothetical protein [Lachnospiraceae bacterium]
MKAANIIGLAIYVVVALFMVAIGIAQLKSKDPVGFYSGEEPPKAESLTDVSAWNKRHGMMWLIYGIIIFVSYLIGSIIGESIWSIIPMMGGVIIPLPFMIWYHHRLMKKFMR